MEKKALPFGHVGDFQTSPKFFYTKTKKVLTNDALSVIILLALSESSTWGYSSAGRATDQ